MVSALRQDYRRRGTDCHHFGLHPCRWGGVCVAGRRYFTDAAAALVFDATLYAGGFPDNQQATLPIFSDWFKCTFPRVEAVREAKRQVEFDFGQTQALEHHNAAFNELLGKLPTGAQALLLQPGHIDHYLSSLSKSLPAELAEDYDPPRKTVQDAQATDRARWDGL